MLDSLKRKLGEPPRLDEDVRRKMLRGCYDAMIAKGESHDYALGYADGYVESLEGAVDAIDRAKATIPRLERTEESHGTQD